MMIFNNVQFNMKIKKKYNRNMFSVTKNWVTVVSSPSSSFLRGRVWGGVVVTCEWKGEEVITG